MISLGLTLDQFIDFVHSYKHQIDREDQNRETFLIFDRTCKKFKWKKAILSYFSYTLVLPSYPLVVPSFSSYPPLTPSSSLHTPRTPFVLSLLPRNSLYSLVLRNTSSYLLCTPPYSLRI